MSKYLKISIIILALFTAYAPSCGDEEAVTKREEEALNETRNEIRDEFETDYLTETSLFAYETTAKQKLSDLAEYLQIMTDTSLDMSFRVKAGELIKNTFQSENETLRCVDKNGRPVKELKVHLLIRKGLKNKLPQQTYTFDSIGIFEPLHRIDNTTYFGVLRFSQNFTDSATSGQTVNSIRRNADFWVKKEDKVFGTDTLKIWNVRLGDIR